MKSALDSSSPSTSSSILSSGLESGKRALPLLPRNPSDDLGKWSVNDISVLLSSQSKIKLEIVASNFNNLRGQDFPLLNYQLLRLNAYNLKLTGFLLSSTELPTHHLTDLSKAKPKLSSFLKEDCAEDQYPQTGFSHHGEFSSKHFAILYRIKLFYVLKLVLCEGDGSPRPMDEKI